MLLFLIKSASLFPEAPYLVAHMQLMLVHMLKKKIIKKNKTLLAEFVQQWVSWHFSGPSFFPIRIMWLSCSLKSLGSLFAAGCLSLFLGPSHSFDLDVAKDGGEKKRAPGLSLISGIHKKVSDSSPGTLNRSFLLNTGAADFKAWARGRSWVWRGDKDTNQMKNSTSSS